MRTRLLALLLCLVLLPAAGFAAPQGPVYEVFVASFADGNGDRMGDLKGLAQKLDYISSLHMRGLWLMPIHPSPSYHKYDVVDYLDIDPAYGTLADFEALAAAAGQRGISLYLDLVINHTSSQHPWFLQAAQDLASGTDSPYTRYYHFSQQGGHPVPGAPGWFYEGHFGPHMPDLDLDDPAVREEIRAILAFWLQKGADGFRLDATTHYYEENTGRNTAFLQWLVKEARALKPDVYIVGEAWKDESTVLSLYESGIDSLFPFPMAGSTGWLIPALREQRGADIAARVAAWDGAIRARNPSALDAPFLSNHDMGRSAGYLMYQPANIKQAAAVYLTMPGVPYVYYGEELGLSGSGRDENKRLPMLWGADDNADALPPADADQSQRQKAGVAEQQADPASILSFYRQVLALRAQAPELLRGAVTALDLGHDALAAWQATQDGQTVTVIHNVGAKTLTIPAPHGSLLGGWDIGSGAPELADGQLTLPPHSGCILR